MSPLILSLLIAAAAVVFLALLATHDQHDDIDPDDLTNNSTQENNYG